MCGGLPAVLELGPSDLPVLRAAHGPPFGDEMLEIAARGDPRDADGGAGLGGGEPGSGFAQGTGDGRQRGGAEPLGQPAALGRPERGERPVDLVLAAGLTGGGAELGVPAEAVAEGGEGEGLQDVLDDPEGDAFADDREVAGGGDGDDVGRVPGGAQRPYEVQAVPVGKVQVEEEQIDLGAFENPYGFGARVRDPGRR
ncbi:hypothetical protein QFZ67_002344 [Streptomyces sp. V1I1]|nr:hypothetical protein [Streptomyces sp. V1I1]